MGPLSGVEPSGSHVVSRLIDYFVGALTVEDEFAVEFHLLECGDCRAEYDDLGEAALLVAALHPGAFGDDDRVVPESASPATPRRGGWEFTVTLASLPDGGTEIRAAVVGLSAGRAYRLIVVDTDARSHVAHRGMAIGGTELVVGAVPLPPDSIDFVALAESEKGAVLVDRPR